MVVSATTVVLGEREALEARWLDLTRRVLPSLAAERRWPIRHDHCFQRVLLDTVFGGCWYDHVAGRPAYRAIDIAQLRRAVRLAEEVVAGSLNLETLNGTSLTWRLERRQE